MIEINTPSGHKQIINPMLVESITPYGSGCRIDFASGKFAYSTESYDDLVEYFNHENGDAYDG